MMKTVYLVAAGAVALLVYQRVRAATTAKTIVRESVIADGSNWQGTMSQRLNAADLILPGFLNIGANANASPSATNKSALGLQMLAGWAG